MSFRRIITLLSNYFHDFGLPTIDKRVITFLDCSPYPKVCRAKACGKDDVNHLRIGVDLDVFFFFFFFFFLFFFFMFSFAPRTQQSEELKLFKRIGPP